MIEHHHYLYRQLKLHEAEEVAPASGYGHYGAPRGAVYSDLTTANISRVSVRQPSRGVWSGGGGSWGRYPPGHLERTELRSARSSNTSLGSAPCSPLFPLLPRRALCAGIQTAWPRRKRGFSAACFAGCPRCN